MEYIVVCADTQNDFTYEIVTNGDNHANDLIATAGTYASCLRHDAERTDQLER